MTTMPLHLHVIYLLSSLSLIWSTDGYVGGGNTSDWFTNVPTAWKRRAMVSEIQNRGHSRLYVPQKRGNSKAESMTQLAYGAALLPSKSKIAFLFLVRGAVPLEPVWTAFFNAPGVQAKDWAVHVSLNSSIILI